jgi:peptidoglycan/LPS O-acetylase OafA/YrhL
MNNNPLISKPHYAILDGLRGVAAITVVIFHIFEAHSPGPLYQIINHGYLAVDFFFLLSGFVIGYAYDDRWTKMSTGNFFKRRLIRLQPMVIMGSIIGAVFFYFQKSTVLWPALGEVPVWRVILIMLIGCTMIPVPPSMDIRGWHETYPLNGPAWSLFFEYIANILYALVIRRFSKTLLAILVFISACALVHYSVTVSGDLIGGWSLEPLQLRIGFTRLMYPFFAGLLLSRTAKLVHIKHAFFKCSVLLLIVLSVPRFGGSEHLWINGLYESLTIIFIFPLIVFLGAGGEVKGKTATAICKFLGNISYPIYIIHYPLIYWYTGYVVDHKLTIQQAYPYSLLVIISSIAIAYACLKWYDEPVRAWLKRKFD